MDSVKPKSNSFPELDELYNNSDKFHLLREGKHSMGMISINHTDADISRLVRQLGRFKEQGYDVLVPESRQKWFEGKYHFQQVSTSDGLYYLLVKKTEEKKSTRVLQRRFTFPQEQK